jgi:hypothetical protein
MQIIAAIVASDSTTSEIHFRPKTKLKNDPLADLGGEGYVIGSSPYLGAVP